MAPISLRLAQVGLGAQLAVCTALSVSVVMRAIDALVDQLTGQAFALFDDGGFGFDSVMVGALWDQWFVLWAILAVVTPLASAALVAALRRIDNDVEIGPAGTFLAVLVPIVGTAFLVNVADAARNVAHLHLPEAHRERVGVRISQLARAVPASIAVGCVVAFLGIFATAIKNVTVANMVIMLCLLLPTALPSALRARQLWLILRLLSSLADRDRVDHVRASHSASVGA